MKLTMTIAITALAISVVSTPLSACGKTANADKTTAVSQSATDQTTQLGAPVAFDKKPAAGTKAKCPVMDMEFTVKKDSEFSTYKGKTYVFCCPGCKPKFDKEPEKFLKK